MHTFEFGTCAGKMPTKCGGSLQNEQAVGRQEEMWTHGRKRCASQVLTGRTMQVGMKEKGIPQERNRIHSKTKAGKGQEEAGSLV